eukprot:scaffold7139_cov115-Cylindrotheca_fusiformis.AAC.11
MDDRPAMLETPVHGKEGSKASENYLRSSDAAHILFCTDSVIAKVNPMGLTLRFLLLTVIMFSAGAKAFTASSRPRLSSLARARLMSSSTGGASDTTSIVDTCTQKIKDALEATDVKVIGAYDDPNGSHISVQVVSAKFEGKRPMQRQQLVYKAIWEELQGPVHAVDSMVCKTPDEI